MNHFTTVNDVPDVNRLVDESIALKAEPFQSKIGTDRALGLLFLNPSLRTRMSTQRAAGNLGMQVMVLNIDKDGWKLEFEDGAVMDGGTQEHIKDAARVLSQYCEVLGIRSFAGLKDREEDDSERILRQFMEHASVPVVSLESATLHPLQSLADMMTIRETGIQRPKVAVTWAPHPKPLPQAVVNSFLEWVPHIDAEVTLAHPEGYDLNPKFTQGLEVTNNQEEALAGADFVYTKSWSSYVHYGERPPVKENWTVSKEKMALTNSGRFMHCLPIRRNVVATDEVIDRSLVYEQARNRVFSAQAVLKTLLENTV
ncbi:MAG: N-acetylornithine carbamoyltransferase [Balneolaceae bacterium]